VLVSSLKKLALPLGLFDPGTYYFYSIGIIILITFDEEDVTPL